MLPHPVAGEIQSAVLDVFVELVVVLAIQDEFVCRSIDTHKRVERGTLQTRDLSYQGLVEPVIHVFVLLLLYETPLQSQHLAVLPAAEQHIQVESHSPAAAGKIIGGIVKDLAVFLPVVQRVITVRLGPDHYQGQTIDIHGQADV